MARARTTRFPLQQNPHPASAAEREAVLADPGFGVHFTDHMALGTWTADAGWTDRRITAYGPFRLDPATAVLHYAQEAFEGLKAFAHADGSVRAFRPELNEARLARSCTRLGLPVLDDGDMLDSITALVSADRAWVPTGGEASLYLRPFLFASSTGMSVRAATEVTYCCIASPSGPYFGGDGVQPVDIWFSTEFIRAAPGGTGAAKCGGNYAGSMVAQLEAERHGCSQVGFVDAVERRYVEELGGMNLFALTGDGELITPELSGTILAGVTRGAILELAGDLGLRTVERPIELSELFARADDGSITELFACGTAAVITPIGRVADRDGDHRIGTGSPGEVTLNLRRTLTDIQYGRLPDTRGWLTQLA